MASSEVSPRLTPSFSLFFSLSPSFQINLPIEISAGQWRIASLNGPPTDGQCAFSPVPAFHRLFYQTIHRLTKSLLPCLGARFESRGWWHNLSVTVLFNLYLLIELHICSRYEPFDTELSVNGNWNLPRKCGNVKWDSLYRIKDTFNDKFDKKNIYIYFWNESRCENRELFKI